MKRPESLQGLRAFGGVAVLLCLALLGMGAQASPSLVAPVPTIEASAMAPQSMPAAMDCLPCAICYISPAPSTQGFSGECKEAEAPAWRVHAAAELPTAFCDTGGWHLPLPVRIAYCRWLD